MTEFALSPVLPQQQPQLLPWATQGSSRPGSGFLCGSSVTLAPTDPPSYLFYFSELPSLWPGGLAMWRGGKRS
jgi:hypothetical protein